MVTQYPYAESDERLGGIMQASFRLVRAIDQIADSRIELIVLTHTKHVVSREVLVLPGGTKIIYLPQSTSFLDRVTFGYWSARAGLSRSIIEHDPDLVHGQGTANYIFATTKCRLPHVVTLHGIYRNEMRVVRSRLTVGEEIARWVKVKTEAYYIRRIRSLIAITSEVADFVRASGSNAHVISIDNTIDEEFFSVPELTPDHSPVVLFVAAITYRKGLDFLLSAFVKVLGRRPEAKLRIAGIWDWDPTYVQGLMGQYAALIAAGSVTFLGGISQEQLLAEMRGSYLLCLPSRAESAPMVISQAMAAGRPVVASRTRAIPGMLTDRVHGRLWDVGDIDGLAVMLVEVLGSYQAAVGMGRRSREAARERYSASAVAQKTTNAYFEIANRQ